MSRNPYTSEDPDFEQQAIGEDIDLIDDNVAHLKELIVKLGTKDDTPHLRHELTEIRGETQDMVLDVRDRLNNMPLSQRVQKARLMKEFAEVLRQYQIVQSDSIRKEKIIVNTMASERESETDHQKAVGKDQQDQFQFTLEDMGVEDVSHKSMVEKHAEIKSIEKDLEQINDIFKDMGHIVEEATPHLDAIEENVDTTKIAAEEATTSLRQAMRAAILARWKTILVAILILLIVFVVITIVVAVVVSTTT